jgi:hypothetical protein
MCADCGPKVDDDAILVAVDPISREKIAAAKGIVELKPGLKVHFSRPGLFNKGGELISRGVDGVLDG